MEPLNYKESAEFISNNLRLRTFPMAVKFLKDKNEFPAKDAAAVSGFRQKGHDLPGSHHGSRLWVDGGLDSG